MHLFLHDNSVAHEDEFRQLARSFGATADEGVFYLDAAYGHGFVRQLVISEDLTVYHYEYVLSKPAVLGLQRYNKRRYLLAFADNQVSESTHYEVQIGDISIRPDALAWGQSFFTSSGVDLLITQPPGFKTSQLILCTSREWLDRVGSETGTAVFNECAWQEHIGKLALLPVHPEVQGKIQEIKMALALRNSEQVLDGLCRNLAALYFREEAMVFAAIKNGKFNEADIERVVRWVRSNGEAFYLTPLSKKELASELAMSASKFGNLFQEIYGAPYSNYVLKRRMEWANRELMKQRKVGDVAAALGYENYSRFSEQFQRLMGVKPSWVLKGKGNPDSS